MVLNELEKLHNRKKIQPGPLTPEQRRLFRDEIASLIGHSVRPSGTETAMSFNDATNNGPQYVAHLKDGKLSLVNIDRPFDWREKATQKLSLVGANFGFWPIVSVIAILVVSFYVSRRDLLPIIQDADKRILPRWYYHLFKFTLGHFLTALFLFVYLAETGAVRYDSIMTAITVAIAPFALLRTNFPGMKAGTEFGLDKWYKKRLAKVDEALMKLRYDGLQARINVIAYYNSQVVMRQALLDLYRNHPSPTEGSRLIQELEEAVSSEKDYFNRRRTCARLLLRKLDWDRLKAEGFVPYGWDDDHPLDPQRVVRLAAKFCSRNKELSKRINTLVKKKQTALAKRNPKRFEELQDFLKAEREDALAIEGQLNINIRFYFVLNGFDIERFYKDVLKEPEKISNFKEALNQNAASQSPATSPAAAPSPEIPPVDETTEAPSTDEEVETTELSDIADFHERERSEPTSVEADEGVRPQHAR